MKLHQSQLYFLGTLLAWVVILQGVMLWYLNTSSRFICNGGGAWPFSDIPLFGGTLLTLFCTVLVGFWAWKILGGGTLALKALPWEAFCWGIIVATGFSHTVERSTSECVLDYWQFSLLGKSLYINLGDISLTIGALLIIAGWLWQYRKK